MSSKVVIYRRPEFWSVVFMALMCVGTIVWQLLAEYWADDFFYIVSVAGWERDDNIFCGHPMPEWGHFADVLSFHYNEGNGRLANFLMLFSNYLPMWVVDVLCGIMIGMIPALMLKIVAKDSWLKSPALTVAATALMWLLLPWDDSMVSTDFLFNYAWSSVVMLAAVYMAMNRLERAGRGELAGICALGFLTGFMHEGFGLPVLAWLIVWWLSRRTRRKGLLIAAVAAGLCLCMICPGTLGRIGHNTWLGDEGGWRWFLQTLRWNVVYCLSGLLPWLAVVIAAMVGCLTSSLRQVIRTIAGSWSWLLMGAVAYLIGVMMVRMDRVLWVMDLGAIVVTLRLCHECVVLKGWIRRALTFGVGGLCVAFIINVCYWQDVYSTEEREILRRAQSGDQLALYFTHPQEEEAPWTTLGIVHRINGWNDYTAFYCFGWLQNWQSWEKWEMGPVVDVRYRGLAFDDLPKVPGANDFRGEWPNLYLRDSIAPEVMVTVGEPLRSMAPVNYLLYQLKGRPSQFHARLSPHTLRVRDLDGSWIYRINTPLLPRSCKEREVVSIDTVPRAR